MKTRKHEHFALSLILVVTLGFLPRVDAQTRDRLTEEDEARYSDLMGDPDAVRFLKHFLYPKSFGATKPSPEAMEELEWLTSLNAKGFPYVVAMLQRETDYENPVVLERKANIVNFARHASGDKEPVLEEVRRQLSEGDLVLPRGLHVGFVTHCMMFLAKDGSEEDRDLLAKFLNSESDHNRKWARLQLDRLEKRLAEEGKYPTPPGNDRPDEAASMGEERSVHSNHTPSESPPPKWPGILWFIALILGGLAVVGFARRKLATSAGD